MSDKESDWHIVIAERRPSDAPSVVEEFFDGVVVEIADDALQLRTVSSGGEEAIAWLPLSKIPESERKYIELGVPARVSIVLTQGATVKREHRVRFLRPSQWKPQLPTAATQGSIQSDGAGVMLVARTKDRHGGNSAR